MIIISMNSTCTQLIAVYRHKIKMYYTTYNLWATFLFLQFLHSELLCLPHLSTIFSNILAITSASTVSAFPIVYLIYPQCPFTPSLLHTNINYHGFYILHIFYQYSIREFFWLSVILYQIQSLNTHWNSQVNCCHIKINSNKIKCVLRPSQALQPIIAKLPVLGHWYAKC